ncbi:hypothetical protein L873DRAFT_1794634 [Choiromyces venosus 120613-1]|uniref:Uncharacterized protein n=1 Tax=Choiromyces venosus 120613-1 TaxID=1336337 RepID=A0A3N4J0J1_9PEZI|nr:hypothetical protein L873DRAFT_1794634 [Choiromyces venosus 120613-1]
MVSYIKHPALAILDDLNPAPPHTASMNLDDFEEEVELEENAYEEVGYTDMVAGNEEEEEEAEGNGQAESHNSQASLRNLHQELPPPPRFHPLSHPLPEHT